MEERRGDWWWRKEYSVTEQLASELAQLLGKKLVDIEGGDDERVDENDGGLVKSDSSSSDSDPRDGKSSVKDEPKTESVSTEKAETPSAEEDIELNDYDKPKLVALAGKYGIPFEQKWTADKLRQVIAKAMGGEMDKEAEAEVSDAKPATKAKASAKKAGKPKVGDTILVNEDNGVWNPYEVTGVRGHGVFTKKWQLTVEDEGTDWKYQE